MRRRLLVPHGLEPPACLPVHARLPARSITVPAGAAASAAGVPNGAASLTVEYQAESGAWKTASTAASGVLAGSTALSWGTSFLVSAMRPTTAAGGAPGAASAWLSELMRG